MTAPTLATPEATQQTARPAADAPLILERVPQPAEGTAVVGLDGLTAGGLAAIHAEWNPAGGHAVLSGRRPFLDVTAHAGFRPDGSLDGTVQMRAALTVVGMRLGQTEWTVNGWEPTAPLAVPAVSMAGTTLSIDLSQLPAEAAFAGAEGVVARREGAMAAVELPADAAPEGQPLSPRYTELFRGLLGPEVAEVSVHPDAPVTDAPAFVTNKDLFFAPGIYGVDSPETLRILDAAIRSALAGVFGPIAGSAPPAPAPEQASAPGGAPVSTDAIGATEPPASAPAPGSEADAAPPPAAVTGEAAPAPGTDAAAAGAAAEGGAVPAAPAMDAVVMAEAPTEPSPAAAARGGAVAAGGGGAAAAARALPSAEENTAAARGAVTEPAAETAARAQEEMAAVLGERPPPSPEIVALVERIRAAIRNNRPESEDALLATDPTAEAAAAGATVTSSVDAQSADAAATYNDMATPASGSPALTPTPVATPDASVPGMGVDAATAAPDPLPAESTTLEPDTAAMDQEITDSGIDTRVTREIPDGPFAEVRGARGEMGELAQRTPAEIHAEEQGAIDSAQSDMANLQLQALAALRASREGTVGSVAGAQEGMTGTEELTRDNVSQRAQGIYEAAQTQVTTMLEPLSATALAQWDAGLARLTRQFNDTLARVQRWIDERHSGVLGTIVAVGDYIAGYPDWIMDEYNNAERDFGDGVGELLLGISSDVNAVVLAAQGVIQGARNEINGLFDQMEAEFPDFAATERARFAGMLDGLDAQVTEAQTSFVRDISARAITAVNEAHATVQARRDEAGGLWGKFKQAVQEFIDDPVKAIINGLLRLVGIPPGAFWSLLAQIEQVASDIAENPENFINNLVAGVKLGFQQFYDNFGTHLLGAFWRWLFSGLKTPIPMPSGHDPMSLVSFALQLMGITWPNIREILVRHVGPQAVEILEAAWQILSVLINEGPQGLVNMIKEQLSPENIVGMILDAAIEFIIEKLIVKAAEYVFSLLNPAGAVAQAILLIYRVCSWIFRNAARIFAFVQAVVGGMADVMAGNIGGLAGVVERALASMLVVVIDLFAGLLGLGDLPDEVAGVITRMQAYILGIIDTVIGFIVTQARALLARLGIGGDDDEDDDNENDDDELGSTERFTGGGESHRLWVERSGDEATLMVASSPGPVTAKISEWRGMLTGPDDPRTSLIASIDSAVTALAGDAQALAAAFNAAVQDPSDDVEPPSDAAVEAGERSLASLLRQAFNDFGQASERDILQAIAAALPARVTTFIAGADTTLTPYLATARYVPGGQSLAKDIWTAGIANAPAESAAAAVGTDSSSHRPLLEYFRTPGKQPADAATDDFWGWAQTRGPRGGFAVGVRRAYGDAYVAALKSNQPADIDPIDTPVLTAFTRMAWRASGSTPGQIVNPPKEPVQTDPPLRTAVGGAIVPFLQALASSGSGNGYGLPRLRWAWNEHEPSKTYLSGAFRRADRGQHEWIPTDMLLEVVERAVTSTGFAPSGTRIGVQWINLFHHLRTDTHQVYFRILSTPVIGPDTSVGSEQLAEAGVGIHSGGAYNAPTGRSGAGLIGQEAFHNALRAAFRAVPLTTPSDYIQSLLWVVADVIWDGDLVGSGVPSPVWGAPLAVWFRVPAGARQGGLTLIDLAQRQVANITAIDNDFTNARANLG